MNSHPHHGPDQLSPCQHTQPAQLPSLPPSPSASSSASSSASPTASPTAASSTSNSTTPSTSRTGSMATASCSRPRPPSYYTLSYTYAVLWPAAHLPHQQQQQPEQTPPSCAQPRESAGSWGRLLAQDMQGNEWNGNLSANFSLDSTILPPAGTSSPASQTSMKTHNESATSPGLQTRPQEQ